MSSKPIDFSKNPADVLKEALEDHGFEVNNEWHRAMRDYLNELVEMPEVLDGVEEIGEQ